MHGVEFIAILLINIIIIFGLYLFQKRLVEKSIKHLKDEIQELEDLVAAIIEEFEEIAPVTQNKLKPVINDSITNQPDNIRYPTVADFLTNLENEDYLKEESESISGPRVTADNSTSVLINEIDLSLIESDHESILPVNSELTLKPNEELPTNPKVNEINLEFINDPRHRKILDLWQHGVTIEEIARHLGTGRGEIQLVIGIYKRS